MTHFAITGHVCSIQVGSVQPLQVGGRRLMSAIGKRSVQGPVALGPLGLAGDEQADPAHHGGLAKAVYALPQAHLHWWWQQQQQQVNRLIDAPIEPGQLGENLCLEGLDEQEAHVGDRLVFAHCVLRVTEPRFPCSKFTTVMGYAQAARDMIDSGRSGFYLAVEQAGTLQSGDAFRLEPGPRAISMVQALRHKFSQRGF